MKTGHLENLEAKRDSENSAKAAMRLLVRSANLQRSLLEDRDWQQAMTYLNKVVTGFKATHTP